MLSIYPPILLSTLPAFPVGADLEVWFTLQLVTNPKNSIGHVLVRVVNQNDNQTIIKTSKYPDGTIYKNWNEINNKEAPKYSVTISLDDLAKRWVAGLKYKILMRFGTTEKFNSISNFATWKQLQIDDLTFSEWSTVMIVKAINVPEVYIQNADESNIDTLALEFIEYTSTPTFFGAFLDLYSDEYVEQYKFDLYQGKDPLTGKLLETTGWTHKEQENILQDGSTVDLFRFKTALKDKIYFCVVYSIRTQNGYEASAEPYVFTVLEAPYYADLEGAYLHMDGESEYDRENGCISIYLKNIESLIGSFIIRRTDERSNFRIWEDIKWVIIDNKVFEDWTLLWRDFSIESGIKYRYSFQQLNPKGLRTKPIMDDVKYYALVNFEYSYLYRDDILLKLRFNQKMNTFKYTVLGGKQDTLGGKYPAVTKNGYAYYAEFPVTGLISFLMDGYQTFFSFKDGEGYYYKDELVIPLDKFGEKDASRLACLNKPHVYNPENNTYPTKEDLDKKIGNYIIEDDSVLANIPPRIDSNLTYDNYFIERKFREKVEEFLYDYNYKLYKSPTEGNIVVVLTNITLTPNNTLGRLVFEFTATAYLVIEGTIEELNEYGIIDIGEYQEDIHSPTYLSFGQYVTNDTTIDVYTEILKQEKIPLTNGYMIGVHDVTKIWIDRTGCSFERVVLRIDGQTVVIPPNRLYYLTTPIHSLLVVESLSPVIINYICELQRMIDENMEIVSAIYSSLLWGLLAGVFTDTSNVLSIYQPQYNTLLPPYMLTRPVNTKYNVYKVRNIVDIIQDDMRAQVAAKYSKQGSSFYFDSHRLWTNGSIYYSALGIITIDIEVDPGTTIFIGKKADGSDKYPIVIGPTGRYVLSPMDNLILYVELEKPSFAIVNYKCLTSELKIEKQKG